MGDDAASLWDVPLAVRGLLHCEDRPQNTDLHIPVLVEMEKVLIDSLCWYLFVSVPLSMATELTLSFLHFQQQFKYSLFIQFQNPDVRIF